MSKGNELAARHTELVAELNRIEAREAAYVAWLDRNFHDRFLDLSEEQVAKIRHHICEVIPWDYLTDRRHEVERELHEVDSAYHCWHFAKYGWAAI